MARRPRTPLVNRLPQFPWDSLSEARATAEAHPDGLINLSVGTPVDDANPVAQLGLAQASSAPGYPQTVGTTELRSGIADFMTRRYNTVKLGLDQIIPVIGTKEAIAWLPTILGIGEGHTVVIPELAYPTYEVGALMSGASILRADSTLQVGPASPTLMYINSPSNPTGKVLGRDHLRKVVSWARERGTIVASDECYLGLGWDGDRPMSILDEDVCDGDTTGLLAIHSLSKTSNLASYRAGWLAGDPELIDQLLQLRKHAGLMVPGPIQSAMTAVMQDDGFEMLQYDTYRKRRTILADAFRQAGFTIDLSDAGLYLWVTRGEPCRDTVNWLAERGILVAPGEFYGPKGVNHVRVALTGSDDDIAAAAARLTQASGA